MDDNVDLYMNIDVDQDIEPRVPADHIMARLAAHPLNSCNPPPPEMPDLFDSLIASEGRLKIHITKCNSMSNKTSKRVEDLSQRLRILRAKNTHFKTEIWNKSHKGTAKSPAQVKFEIEEQILQKMATQIAFVHYIFMNKIRAAALSTLKAHRDIFTEFLGERHDHQGIEVANSLELSCTLDCDWYQKHGPYEWSKKPYSNSWQQEMNQTDWDWVRIKEHITAAITVGGGKVAAMYDTFYANTMKFIPPWFWADNFDTWTIQGELQDGVNDKGEHERKPVGRVRFIKSSAMIEQEKTKILEVAKNYQGEKSADDNTSTDIKKTGETFLDIRYVFDSEARMPGPGGQVRFVRWMKWWGIEKWYTEFFNKENVQNRLPE